MNSSLTSSILLIYLNVYSTQGLQGLCFCHPIKMSMDLTLGAGLGNLLSMDLWNMHDWI
jgi:hypothetical protein